MPDKYEQQHLRNLLKKEQEVRKLYEQAIHEITIGYSQIEWNGEIFQLKDYPVLLNRINAVIKKLHAQIYASVVNGIEESWYISFDKNNFLVDKRLAGKQPSASGLRILYDPNLAAMKEFIRRKNKGLNLSDRVWNSLDNYPTELETALGVGVSEGRSASEIATDLKRYLKEPDRLFRRVRTDDGSLKLSRRARNYHPGQGVYRSSYQNALRVSASETNSAYRNADIERWRTLPFVIGYRINLSANHPEFDICDYLQGIYPLSFNWTSWHPRCLCFLTAEQISDEEYDKYEDAILAGQKVNIKKIEKVPDNFIRYVEQNAERINGWNSLPYWVTQNRKITSPLLSQ